MTSEEMVKAAADLESAWLSYRRKIWLPLPLPNRMKNADVNLRMSKVVARAVDMLREASGEDPDAHGMLADVSRELSKLKSKIGKRQAM